MLAEMILWLQKYKSCRPHGAVFMHTVVPSCFAYLHHVFNMWHSCFFWIHSSVVLICASLWWAKKLERNLYRLAKNDWLLIQEQHFSIFSRNLDMIQVDRILMEAPVEENNPKRHCFHSEGFFMEGKIKKEENVRYEDVAQRLLSVNVSKAFHVLKFIDSHRCKGTRRHISLEIPDRHTHMMCIDCTQG